MNARRRVITLLVLCLGAAGAVAAGNGAGTARATGTGGTLWLYGSDATLDTGLAMEAGTSPAITDLPDGAGDEVAFEGSNGRPVDLRRLVDRERRHRGRDGHRLESRDHAGFGRLRDRL